MKAETVIKIEKSIGYVFKDKKLLETCFTHSSYTNEHGCENNERLEFLGDALLGFFVADYLYKTTFDNEKEMTEKRKALVAKLPLENAVKIMGIEKFILGGGNGENIGEKAISSLFEALVAGIYIDGGLSVAEKFVLEKLLPYIDYTVNENYKGRLQEYLQSQKIPNAQYSLINECGKAHSPEFSVTVSAGGVLGKGNGKSKKTAEQAAAKDALIKLGVLK